MKPDFRNRIRFSGGSENLSGTTITLPSQVVVKEIPAYQVKTTTIEITQIIDDSTTKTITAYTKQFGAVVLWQGAAYDAIGQWTDNDVKARLIALYVK
jgi:hypothetical protein